MVSAIGGTSRGAIPRLGPSIFPGQCPGGKRFLPAVARFFER
jgi:hypothetical protein